MSVLILGMMEHPFLGFMYCINVHAHIEAAAATWVWKAYTERYDPMTDSSSSENPTKEEPRLEDPNFEAFSGIFPTLVSFLGLIMKSGLSRGLRL